MIDATFRNDIREEYPEAADMPSLTNCLKKYVELSGRKIFFVIDEWDALIREAKDDNVIQERYLNFLRSLFKNRDFTPYSVMRAVDNGIYQSYWKKTSAADALSTYINMNFEGLKEDVVR